MAKEPAPNIDALLDAILQDELEDLHALHRKMSVREYAKFKKMQPQLIYYYIRTRQLKEEPCSECGRKVIDVQTADRFFAERDARKRTNT